MDLDELRSGLARQERSTPELDAVRSGVQRAAAPARQRGARGIALGRAWPVAASLVAIALVALTIALVHSRTTNSRLAVPSGPTVAGIHWQLTAATVVGMPNYGVQPDLTESLYLYPDATSLAIGFCFTRQGTWQQDGTEVVFTDQHTLQHPCALQSLDTAPQHALLQLDGRMDISVVGKVMQLNNSGTAMTFRAVGPALSNPGPSAGTPVNSAAAALGDISWTLTSAVQAGRDVALPPGKATTMQLYLDGSSSIAGPGCFYRTGRWHQVPGGIEFTDQVTPVMGCYAIRDMRDLAGRQVLDRLAGTIEARLSGDTLTLKSGGTSATFTN